MRASRNSGDAELDSRSDSGLTRAVAYALLCNKTAGFHTTSADAT